MNKRYASVICLFSLFTFLRDAASQDLDLFQLKLESFDYAAVIEMAEDAISRPENYTHEQLIKIYEMKGVAHFSRNELTHAKDSFEEILQRDSLHELDPVKTSPKIIEFFDTIKREFETEPIVQPEKITVYDTVVVVQETMGRYQKALPVSLLLPGTGHLYLKEYKRGTVLTALSAITLSSALYYSITTESKEKEYMNAVDPETIHSSYEAYNSAYRTRNALWIAYAAVWIYTQTDLIFFHERRRGHQLSLSPPLNDSPMMVSLNFCF